MHKLSHVSWEDVAGLEEAKVKLNENVIMRLKNPHNQRNTENQPSVLLYGPPGTGKTLLAKAVGTQVGSSRFFSTNASEFLSKWWSNQRETCKLIKDLFDHARANQPCVLFFDDVDMLALGSNDSENVKRLKIEFLNQMEMLFFDNENNVIVLGATNRPWCFDSRMRKMLERLFYNKKSFSDNLILYT